MVGLHARTIGFHFRVMEVPRGPRTAGAGEAMPVQHRAGSARGRQPGMVALRSHRRFVPPYTRFTAAVHEGPRWSVPLFLKRECDRILYVGRHAPGGRGEAAGGGGEVHREQVHGRAGPCEDEGGRVLRVDSEGGLGAAFRSTAWAV